MVTVSASRRGSLERRSSGAFLAGGVLLAAYAAFNGIDASTAAAYPNVENVLGPAGFALGFVGLLGLYPRLVDRRPRLARAGAVCVALGTVGFSVIAVANLGQLVGVLSGDQPSWAVVFVALAGAGMIPGYLCFAAATWRTGVGSRRLGLLLLAPLAVFAAMVASSTLGFFSQWLAVAISGGQAVAHLAIGYALRVARGPVGREVPSDDATAS